MEIDYNTRAFVFIVVGAIIGGFLVFVGEQLKNKYFFIIGGIMLIVAILVGFLLTGIIFALRWYSDVGGFLDHQVEKEN